MTTGSDRRGEKPLTSETLEVDAAIGTPRADFIMAREPRALLEEAEDTTAVRSGEPKRFQESGKPRRFQENRKQKRFHESRKQETSITFVAT
jgi:hypothetical protein